MRSTFIVLAMLLAAPMFSQVAYAPETQRFRLQFAEAPPYATGRDVEVKTVTLRLAEFVTPVPKQKLEYLKLEVWLTNIELDVCAAPELAEIESIPLASQDDFILVWQGVNYGWSIGAKGGNKKAVLWQTLFANRWTADGGGEPVVLSWYDRRGATTVRLLPNSGETTQPASDRKGAMWEVRTPWSEEDIKLLPNTKYQLGTGNWIFRHNAARKLKHKEWNYRNVVLAKSKGMPLLAFQTKGKKLSTEGAVVITRICPEIVQEKRFWLDDKVPR